MKENEKVSKKDLVSIFSVALVAFLSILTETSMNVTFPTLMKSMNVSLNLVQWITTGYLLTVAILMIISAYLKQRFKSKTLFIAATIFFVVGDLICIFSPNFPILLFGRIIQAFSAGISIPLMYNIILENVPISKLGFYIGIAALVIMIAPATGPTYGGLMVSLADWRMIFWSTLPVIFILMFIGIKTIHQVSPIKKTRFELKQFILLAAGLVLTMLGFSNLSISGVGSWQFLGTILAAIIAFALYYVVSQRSDNQLINIKVFKNPMFKYSFLAYVILQFCNLATNFSLPNYAQIIVGASSLIGGLVLLPGSLLTAISQPWFGHLLDRYGAKIPIISGSILVTISAIGFTVFGLNLTVAMIIIFYTVFSFGRSMAFGNSLTYGLKSVPRELTPDANAIFNTGQQFAGSLGTTVMAAFMSSDKAAGVSYATATAVGSHRGFVFILILSLINFVLYYQAFKKRA
ncbi:MFS transporter [Lactobacillus terrae]|uniref:MFS transporter n=1 Tax=Lactobacillus terrae TaxID=2269374 RepID=UPI000C1B636E|nr:MFS transporter [Lactobacillus terrae]